MLILGTGGLFGLGWAVQSIGVHGSTNERAAIRSAVRAPFADLRRRDAHALCADFMPSVAAGLVAGGGGDCEQRVSALFRRARDAGEFVATSERQARTGLAVSAIHWHGSAATAAAGGRANQLGGRAWKLDMHAQRWRIATPATLEMRSDCGDHAFGAAGCVYAVSLHFAGG